MSTSGATALSLRGRNWSSSSFQLLTSSHDSRCCDDQHCCELRHRRQPIASVTGGGGAQARAAGNEGISLSGFSSQGGIELGASRTACAHADSRCWPLNRRDTGKKHRISLHRLTARYGSTSSNLRDSARVPHATASTVAKGSNSLFIGRQILTKR